MKIRAILFVFAALYILPTPVMAQGHGVYCEQADSTAATQKCLKRHLDSAQKRLKTIYDTLNAGMDDEKKQELSELQKSWLAYRDAECMWEAQNADTASLKRINELSCMARVTDDRADILTIVHEDKIQLDTVREYGSFPRWMNVVAKENTDVFWNYGKRTGIDLDCDGEDEYLMSGIQSEMIEVKATEDVEKTEYNIFKNHVVLALAQNTSVGKPTAQIFKFLVNEEGGEDAVCSQNLTLNYNAGEKSEDEVCQARLEIKAGKCDPKNIIWTGEKFEIEKIEAPAETEE